MHTFRRLVASALWSGEPTNRQLQLWIEILGDVLQRHGIDVMYWHVSWNEEVAKRINFDKSDYENMARCFAFWRQFLSLFRHSDETGAVDYNDTCRDMIALLYRRMQKRDSVAWQGDQVTWDRLFADTRSLCSRLLELWHES